VSTGDGVIEEAENIKKFFPLADLNQGESIWLDVSRFLNS
jgi:hypothetical protein